MLKKWPSLLLITAVSFWFGWTILIDFFVVPTVFEKIDQFFLAGDLGIALFSKLNNLEVVTGSFILSGLVFRKLSTKKDIVQFILALLLMGIALTYFTYLTPKITDLTELWKKAEATGSFAIAGISDIQQEHQFYHRLYIWLDCFKLFLLSAVFVLEARRS
jgi:hypothetical protein